MTSKNGSSRTSLFFVLVALIASLGVITAANSQDTDLSLLLDFPTGEIITGDTSWWERADGRRINVTPAVVRNGSYVLIEHNDVANAIGIWFTGNNGYVDKFQKWGLYEEKVYGEICELSVNNTPDCIGVVTKKVNTIGWYDVKPETFLLNGIEYYYVKLSGKEDIRAFPKTKGLTTSVKYYVTTNATGADWVSINRLEVDPLVESYTHRYRLNQNADDTNNTLNFTENGNPEFVGDSIEGNGSMKLDGTNYLSATSMDTGYTKFSIAVWANLTTIGAGTNCDNTQSGDIFNQQAASWGITVLTVYSNSGDVRLCMGVGNGVSNTKVDADLPDDIAGSWQHFGGTFATGSDVIIYHNGTIIGSVALPGRGTNNGNAWIGASNIGFYKLNGQLDDVRFWIGENLSEEDMTELHDSYVVEDVEPPTFNGTSNNGSTAQVNASVGFGINWLEETNYQKTDFAHNDSGNLVNGTPVYDSGTSGTVNTSMTVTAGRGTFICGQFTLTDAAGNSNQTTLGDPTLCFTVQNTIPTHGNPVLTSTSGNNFTSDNLTCTAQNTADVDSDSVKNIFDWSVGSTSIAVLNMPFERVDGTSNNNTKDYSSYGNDGVENGGIVWLADGGFDGKGAYEFDGVDDYVDLDSHISNFQDFSEGTIGLWFKTSHSGSYQRFLSASDKTDDSSDVAVGINSHTNGSLQFLGRDGGIGGFVANTNALNYNDGIWHHFVVTVDSFGNRIFVDGSQAGVTYFSGDSSTQAFFNTVNDLDVLRIGNNEDSGGNQLFTNGTIDEVRIYDKSLSAEQISAIYNNRTDLIVSQETTAGKEYLCSVTPNDGFDDGQTLNSSSLLVVWSITFNVTSGEFDQLELNNVSISSCTYTRFNQSGDPSNPYGPYGFPPGDWQCTFEKDGFYPKTETFTANDDKIVDVIMSSQGQLTDEEHTWLEALYACVILKDCDLYNLLLEINQTAGNIWEHTKPTDESVVVNETVINKVVNSTNNLTINYTVNIPVKAGYSLGAYLPVRIGYWFLNEANTSCFNQGDRPTGVDDPYCQPLVIETIGPMGGSVNFTVELQPQLPAGDYSIKRIIDIDPNDVWVNYGQEEIGTVAVSEDIISYGISLIKTGEVLKTLQESTPTGAVIKEVEKEITGSDELSSLISLMKRMTGMMVAMFVVVIGLFVYMVIDRKR